MPRSSFQNGPVTNDVLKVSLLNCKLPSNHHQTIEMTTQNKHSTTIRNILDRGWLTWFQYDYTSSTNLVW